MVLERTDEVTWSTLRNACEVHVVSVDQLNTYDVLASRTTSASTKAAYDAFVADAPRGQGGGRGGAEGRAEA